jgi:hypothetical protein
MPTYEDAPSSIGESASASFRVTASRGKSADPNNLPHRNTAVQWTDGQMHRSPGVETASAMNGESVHARAYKGHSCGFADCPKDNLPTERQKYAPGMHGDPAAHSQWEQSSMASNDLAPYRDRYSRD